MAKGQFPVRVGWAQGAPPGVGVGLSVSQDLARGHVAVSTTRTWMRREGTVLLTAIALAPCSEPSTVGRRCLLQASHPLAMASLHLVFPRFCYSTILRSCTDHMFGPHLCPSRLYSELAALFRQAGGSRGPSVSGRPGAAPRGAS